MSLATQMTVGLIIGSYLLFVVLACGALAARAKELQPDEDVQPWERNADFLAWDVADEIHLYPLPVHQKRGKR
jgi:hypothetical protein